MSKNYVEHFGKYILLEKLASGGMAEVYLSKSASGNDISKFVALKRILPQFSDNPEFIEMFREEAKIAVNLSHSNVVSIFDFGIESNQLFIVMDYVEGRNLRQILNHLKKSTAGFSIDQIVYVIKEVAAGLDHAHRCMDGTTGRPLNITHRDMSPQNIMISFEGEVKVIDFGIAKAESQMEQTKAGTLKGKFGYMSPEQAEGLSIDLRTDIFSLGIVLWEMLANDRLFVSNNEVNTLRKIRDCQIPPLRKINPNIPPELERIVNKALTKDRNLRYQTAAALHRDLNRFLNTHYPDFLPQDFSIFMKSLFSNDIMDIRSRMVAYAKVRIEQEQTEKTEVTDTLTDADLGRPRLIPQAPNNPDKSEADLLDQLGPDLDNTQSNIDFKSLTQSANILREKKQRKYIAPKPPLESSGNNKPGPSVIPIRRPDSDIGRFVRTFALSLAVITLAFFAYTNPRLLEHTKATLQSFVPQTKDLASTQTNNMGVMGDEETTSREIVELNQVPVHIRSQPSGARININDNFTGYFTPARVLVPAKENVRVSLEKKGYLTYAITRDFTRFEGGTIQTTLQPIAYLHFGTRWPARAASQVRIEINGVLLSETPPISNYPVPANSEVRVRVKGGVDHDWVERSLRLGPHQQQSIDLDRWISEGR